MGAGHEPDEGEHEEQDRPLVVGRVGVRRVAVEDVAPDVEEGAGVAIDGHVQHREPREHGEGSERQEADQERVTLDGGRPLRTERGRTPDQD